MSCRTHCCKRHGCKYGYEHIKAEGCPVVNGTIKQEHPCEYCINVPNALRKIKELQAEIAFIQELKAEGIDTSYNEKALDNGLWDD